MIQIIICAIVFFVLIFFCAIKTKSMENKYGLIFGSVLVAMLSSLLFNLIVTLAIGSFGPRKKIGEDRKNLTLLSQRISVGDKKIGNVLLIFDGNSYSFVFQDETYGMNNSVRINKKEFNLVDGNSKNEYIVQISEKYVLDGRVNWLVFSRVVADAIYKDVITYEALIPKDKILYIHN